MSAVAEYRESIVRRFAERMVQGDFFAQRGVAALGGLPCTEKPDGVRTLSHTNMMVALQVLQDRDLSDPRFYTLAQIEKAGWRLRADARALTMQSVQIQYQSPSDGGTTRLRVYSAADIDGPAPWVPTPTFEASELASVLVGSGDLVADLDVWVSQAGHTGDAALLRRQLLGALLAAAGGHDGLNPILDEDTWNHLAAWVTASPEHFYSAVGDAELLYAGIADQIKSLQFESARGVVQAAPARVARGRGGENMATADRLAWVNQQYRERQAVLAVPYAQRGEANDRGAIYHPEHRLWFVPAGVDRAAFADWELNGGLSNVASDQMIKDAFVAEMKLFGLREPKELFADGKWHNVAVDKKGANNAGAYMLVTDNVVTPYGKISNKLKGERVDWVYQGNLLTPEQRKRLQEQARANELIARKEEQELWDRTALKAQEIFSKGVDPAGHGYLHKKGIVGEGLRQIAGSELLKYEEFYGISGKTVIRSNQMYLLVPLQDERGQTRNLQAISPDGKYKSFMRDAQKSGLMFVLGAPSFESLKLEGCAAVSYSEGYATGFDFQRALRVPMVVTFDAGNLETVVKRTAPQLPTATLKVLAIDNDQFQAERALTYLAEKVGVNPFAADGRAVDILSRYGRQAQHDGATRAVPLGAVVADGEWHQAPKGKYRVRLIPEPNGVAIRSLHVDVVVTDGKEERFSQRFDNRGAEAGKVAQTAAENCFIVAPSFDDLRDRPSDWNDLMKAQGLSVVTEQITSQLEGALFQEWFKSTQGRHGHDMDEPHALDHGVDGLHSFADAKALLQTVSTHKGLCGLVEAVNSSVYRDAQPLQLSDAESEEWTELVRRKASEVSQELGR